MSDADVRIEVVGDPSAACAAMLIDAVTAGGDVVLTGGSTPRPAYEELARAISESGLDASSTTLWFADERCVPPDDDRSNYLMVRRALFDRVGEGRFAGIHRIQGELGYATAADSYDGALRSWGPPEFAFVLLGIGSDGHTASMFPDQSSLAVRDRFAVGVPEAGLEPFVPRVTLTLPALGRGRQIVVLASGASKADPVAAAFGRDARPDPHVPASMLATLGRDVTVLIDEAAAGKL
ncbi:MAG TPA: 6-phosphogluconolactonase [Solirubrobacteraceae bacterium]|nr:6-phosphogluconolactonase [Solirubrobacteraceae bacterium]